MKLLEIGANEIDQVLDEFRGDLLFGPIDEVEADMRLEHLGHQAVHAASNGSQQHQLVSAVLVARQRSFNGLRWYSQSGSDLGCSAYSWSKV